MQSTTSTNNSGKRPPSKLGLLLLAAAVLLLALTVPQLQQNSRLSKQLHTLQAYGETQLADISCRKLVTFHDGFGWLAKAFDLEILAAIEEESGSEASAQALIGIIELVDEHQLPAVFTETNGSSAAASIIAAETGTAVFTLDMAMGGSDYLQAMYANIDLLKEALQ